MDSLLPASKIADMRPGWLCGQTAGDFVVTKTGRRDSIDIQTAEEFRTTKFFCKTSFDTEQIKAEEADYHNYPIPKFYHFDSEDSKERILYSNFDRIDSEVKTMIKVIQTENKKNGGSQVAPRKAAIKTNKNKSS